MNINNSVGKIMNIFLFITFIGAIIVGSIWIYEDKDNGINDFCIAQGYAEGTLWFSRESGVCWNITYIDDVRKIESSRDATYDNNRWWFKE